jgi:hypothetical protein
MKISRITILIPLFFIAISLLSAVTLDYHILQDENSCFNATFQNNVCLSETSKLDDEISISFSANIQLYPLNIVHKNYQGEIKYDGTVVFGATLITSQQLEEIKIVLYFRKKGDPSFSSTELPNIHSNYYELVYDVLDLDINDAYEYFLEGNMSVVNEFGGKEMTIYNPLVAPKEYYTFWFDKSVSVKEEFISNIRIAMDAAGEQLSIFTNKDNTNLETTRISFYTQNGECLKEENYIFSYDSPNNIDISSLPNGIFLFCSRAKKIGRPAR